MARNKLNQVCELDKEKIKGGFQDKGWQCQGLGGCGGAF